MWDKDLAEQLMLDPEIEQIACRNKSTNIKKKLQAELQNINESYVLKQ